ncbi:hypothetical protein RDI58_016650 [Solanum bulbocastanum]|uniref:Yippee domain-containing protein n=1 Tax=Solanum bulbocastanum TaxID=147425 RepID=A0AAN8YCK8_SOLBU
MRMLASTVILMGAERKLHGSTIMLRWFNVHVPDNESYHRAEIGTDVAKIYCLRCRKMIGWKIIGVRRQHMYVREGKYCMRLKKLCLWNNVLLLRIKKVQDLHTYEENADQDGDTNEHEVGANEQNVDQGGGGNELNHEEDVGVIRFNVPNFLTHFINKNAYQGGGGNELNHEQDVGN